MSPNTAGNDIEPLHYSSNAILLVISLFPVVFIAFGFIVDTPEAVFRGTGAILMSRDTLISDYIGLGGMGAAFVNAGMLMAMVTAVYYRSSAAIGGTSVACLFLVLGFGLFGKNMLNIWFIVLGVFLYTRFKKERFSSHINTAFFGAALAPIFTEILFSTALPLHVSVPLSMVTTLVLGFVLVPIAAQVFKAHMGFSLYNIGFVAGIVGALIVALYRSYGFVPEPVFIWTTGNNTPLGALLVVTFILMAAGGLFLDRNAVAHQVRIMRLSGQAPTDFIAFAGIGPALFNMSLTGAIGTAYVLLVGGDLNGPTVGAILAIVGFSACGKHPKNILPIIAGIFIGSLAKPWNADDPSAVLAALFGTTLAPIAGRFGWQWGIVAGFLHSSVAQHIGQFHGGLVLYKNGFAAGLVATILVPVILAVRSPAESD
jgi:hypothetical protein